MGIGKKMTKGMIHGGVDLSHKGPKMSGKAKSLESYPGGMPGPGAYGSMNNKVVGKGMMKYMSGEPVGMAKYKSNAQRKAAHASMAEQGAGKYGKHMGPEKALVGKQENLPEALKAKIEAAPGMYGKKKKGMKQMGEMEEPPMSGGPSKYGKHKGPGNFGVSTTGSDKKKKETRLEKTKRKVKDAKKATVESGKKSGMSDETNRQTAKAKRLEKRQKRQEGRAERKTIRKNKDLSRGDKRKQIIDSREKQNKKGPAKTKKYIQDKEGKIEGKAKRIIGSGSGKVLASRDKKEVGKKYKK